MKNSSHIFPGYFLRYLIIVIFSLSYSYISSGKGYYLLFVEGLVVLIRKVIIIGSGPAGLTSALYTARGNLNPLVISGFQWGGQLMLTSEVENYPGFPEGIMGPDLMSLMRKQVERFGAEFVDDNVTKVDFSSAPFKITVGDDVHEAHCVPSNEVPQGELPEKRSSYSFPKGGVPAEHGQALNGRYSA